jgi:outer membrane receptor protein involved in Fe transport
MGALGVLALAFIAGAQTGDGTVSGYVTDPSGSGVPAAKVALRNSGTQVAVNTETNSTGFYTFQFVVPGTYQVSVEAPGFQREVHPDIHVEVAQSVRQDFALQVGQTQQEVTVSGGSELIQTDNASMGTVISQRAISELPLNGRNPLALVALTPGVVPEGQSQQNGAGTNNSAYGNFQIGGGVANQSNWMLDGATMVIPFGHAVELLPSQELVKEFNVMENNLPPQYGGFAGGVVNLTTKTGTNDLHGDAYEFLRNKVLNANTFFNNRNHVPRGAFTQNQFGGTFGGPVVIPHLYNGKNKTFFFANYEGFRLRQGAGLILSVPTQAMRNGDFSALGVNIYNPFTTTATGPNTYSRQQASCNGKLNVICPSQIDPVAAHLVNLWALPNLPGAGAVNNWVGNVAFGGNTDQGTIRIDHTISDKQRLFWRYTYWADVDLAGDPFGNTTYAGNVGTPENYNTLQTVIDDTYTFSPHTVMDVRADLLRFRYVRSPQSVGFDATTIGWPAYMNTEVASQVRTLPSICVNDGIYTEFCGLQVGSIIAGFDTDVEIAPTVTTVHGHHTINFGGEWKSERHNYGQTQTATGGYNFTSAFTAANALNGSGGGSAFASFLYGAVNSGSVQEPAFTASQQLYGAVYVNDVWQVTHRLTVNAGVRWELTGPWTERYNRISVFFPNAASPLAATTGLPLKGDVGLVATSMRPDRTAVNSDYHEFSPRVGVAYMLTPSTVIRSGYGIFWLPEDVNLFASPDHDSINAISESMNTSLNNGITPFNVLSNPFPGGIIPAPQRNVDPNVALYGNGVLTQIPQNPLGYSQQWNFDIQKQFGPSFLVDLGYVGSKGTHLPIQTQSVNYVPLQLVQQQVAAMGATAFLGTTQNPFFGKVPSNSPFNTSTIAYEQLLRPYPQFQQVQYASQGDGDNEYESLQLKVQKRFNTGGTLLLAYTKAKLLGIDETQTSWLESSGPAGFQYWGNLRLEKSLSSFDVSQRMVLSYVVDLPFGKGRKFMSHPNGVVQAVAGGWGLDGILTLQTGFPIAIFTNNNNIHVLGGGARPNFNTQACPSGAGVSGSRESRLNEWFNINCFVAAPPFTLGNVSRTLPNVRMDGVHNLDFALFKNFPLFHEGRLYLQLRGEAFNLLNTPQFGPPTSSNCPCNGNNNNGRFGVITSQANNPRLIQVAGKIVW